MTWSWSWDSFTIPEIPGPSTKSTLPGWQYISLKHSLLNILRPVLRSTAQKKKSFKNITEHFDDEPGHPRAPVEMYSEIHIVSKPVNTSIL